MIIMAMRRRWRWSSTRRSELSLLARAFFQIHDPTTYEQQGSDVGPSYRSAIFYTDKRQMEVALETIAEIEASGRWPGPVLSEINPEEPFWEAEPEHQKYLLRYPRGYSCHFARPLGLDKDR